MHLVVADIHFGRDSEEVEREKERQLVSCLRSFSGEVDGLILLGDIFDYYVEYSTLVPKGFLRFQALLAEWADQGVHVLYLAGNHDPWHIDYY
ncbi:MAG: metallophosphoesterase, partial [Bacteroidota bacterium]